MSFWNLLFQNYPFNIGCRHEKQDREPEEVAKLEENIKKAVIPISAELGISQIYYSRFSYA